jgi:cbb3-type cytochrome oxidase maturation protein
MSVLYVVLPLALLLAIVAVAAFIWAVRSGQLDDLQTPALRMLHDDVPQPLPNPAAARQTASERRHRESLASTQAETPRARSRASINDADDEQRPGGNAVNS